MIEAARLNKCELYQVNDFAGVSVWMPPGTDVGNPATMIQAGLFRATMALGVKGIIVSMRDRAASSRPR